MFNYLKPFDKIVVTGPQRSGTRICAKMICHDLGKKYYSEADVGISVWPLLKELVETKHDFVVQCPGLCRYVHTLEIRNDTAVVLMRRPVKDIIRSQKRINWHSEPEEIERYLDTPLKDISPPISRLKYMYWSVYQKPRLGDMAFEIEYDSLSEHPMWVPKDQRKGWTHGQTEPGKPEKFGPKEKRRGYRKRMKYEGK